MISGLAAGDDDLRVGNQGELLPPMSFHEALDLLAHLFFPQCFCRDPGADLHDLDGDDSHLPLSIIITDGRDVGKELGVRVDADANTMDEEHRQPRLGRMGPVPIR